MNPIRLALILGVAFWMAMPGPPTRAQQVDDETFIEQMGRNKLPVPLTLDQFSAQIKRMRTLGADNSQIAEYMSKVIDNRLEANNKLWGESMINPLKPGQEADRERRWKPLRDYEQGNDGLPGKPIDDGRKAQHFAELAWQNSVGNCAESASVAYTVLQQAGIPARIFNASAGMGHEFSVIGLAPGADPNNPSTWGPDARVIDGWLGRSMTPEQAFNNRHIFNGRTTSPTGKPMVGDFTDSYDSPTAQNKYNAFGTKGRLRIEVEGEDGKPAAGAKVSLSADEPQEKVTSGQGFVTFDLYPGNATVSVVPAKDSGLADGAGTATVQTKRIVVLKIKLKAASENTVTITSPADGAEIAGDTVTVTGTLEGTSDEPVQIQANAKQTTAEVSGKDFTAIVSLADDKTFLQAIRGKARSAVITVTRVNAPKPTFDGTWVGEITGSYNHNGEVKKSRFSNKLVIRQTGNELAGEQIEVDGKPIKTVFKGTVMSPQIAVIPQKREPMMTDYFRISGRVDQIYLTLREGKLYLDCTIEYTYSVLDSHSKSWVSHSVKSTTHGVFQRTELQR